MVPVTRLLDLAVVLWACAGLCAGIAVYGLYGGTGAFIVASVWFTITATIFALASTK